MARLDDVERRLLNWARWKVSANATGLGYASLSLKERVDGGGYRTVGVPTLEHDACEVDEAIKTLSNELQATLEVVYVSEAPASVQQQRLGVGYGAIKQRVAQAHIQLSRIFEERRQVLLAAREAFEKSRKLQK